GRDPDTTPVYVVQPGVNGNLIDASRETSRESTYNIVIARGSDPAFPTGYQIAYNTDPNSPLRWDGPFGPAPRYYASPLLRTDAAAAQAAATVLSKYTGLPTTQGLWTVPNPALRPYDMLSARIVGLPTKHLIDEITIPLAGDESVQISTKTAASVVEPNAPSQPPPNPDVGFTQAQIDQEKAFEITSTAENSTLAWWENYRYIEDGAGIGDDRGYTGGIVGFTTATGDMLDLVKNYFLPNNATSPLASFVTGLTTCASVGRGSSASSTANTSLGTSYMNAWKAAADGDAAFRKAQRDYRSDNYWDPAFAKAQSDGLRALGAAIYYDTYVNHGPGEPSSGDGSFEDIRSQVTLPGGGGGGGGASIGNTANGTGASASTANKTVVSKFTAGAGGTLDAGHARLWVDTGIASIEMVVYADSSGAPGALLAKSDTLTVSNTSEADKTFAFTGSQRITLASGTAYWIGFTWADPGTNTISWSRSTTASQAQQNSSHAASTFGTGTALSGPIDAYVTLAASGGSTGGLSDADETTYLNNFLNARSTVLTAWGDNPADGRIHMFRDLVTSGNFTLHTPFSWSVYGDAFQLAQDPTPRDVPGSTTPPDTTTGFTTPGAALNIRKADGGNHFNIGVAYAANNPFGSSPVHHDYSMAEIENGLNLPGHYELMPNGNVRYTVPLDGGRTSENTKYPRVEHRGLNPDNSKQSFSKGTAAYVQAAVMPIKVPPNKPEWVCLQFHDADDDVAMIHIHDDLVRAKIKGEYIGTLQTGWNKQMTTGRIEVLDDGTVEFYWGSLTTPALTSTQWTGGFSGWYAKAGAYSQSWGGSGTRGGSGPTDDVADGPLIIETDPSKFEMWQDGWAKPARLTPPSTGGGTGGGTGGTGGGTGGGTTPPPSSDDGTQAAVVLGWGPVIDGDEFDYSGAPRSDKWSMYDGPGHDGNGIRSPDAFSVANGVLTCYGDNVNGGTTGGMAFERNTKYVRIEWRVRTYSINPSGGGNRYHPVLIMWPQSDRWPQDGEYDFYECDCDSGKYEHYEHIPGNDGSAQEYDSFDLDIQNWHNVAFEWSKTGIKGFVDGKKVWQYDGSYILAPGPMHPTIQLDNFHGSNMEPAKFEAKWVRIYASPS
ncbi:MAG TPA: chitosanase, partial [Microbacterium sp.]|nr:chitosanase [Microbacterium sp.]